MGPQHFSILYCLLLCGITGCSCEPQAESEWLAWKQKFGKMYRSKSEEYDHRNIWMNNYRFLQKHNRTSAGYDVELNFMADKNVSRLPIEYQKDILETAPRSHKSPPDSWDWRQKGAIGPVQNQGQLGDVQTIVTTECVESYGFIHKGQLMRLSTSEVHDCCVKSRLAVDDVYTCVHDIGGLCTEASYPNVTGRCMNASCTAVVQVNGGKMVPRGDEMALLDAVHKMPVMALIDASHPSFQMYVGGIYSEPACSSTRLDHAVQVVGYGSLNGKDFWICKNSWGTVWGMKGYVLMARNQNNMCGIATQATYPV